MKHQRSLEGLHERIHDGTDVFYERNSQDVTQKWGKYASDDVHRKFAKEATEKYGYIALVLRHR